MKNKKLKKFLIPILIVFILSLLLLVVFSVKSKSQTTYPSDYNIERQGYDFFYEFDVEQSGVITIPSTAVKDNIYKIIINIKGCSFSSDVFLNDIKVGNLRSMKCEDLFYEDNLNEMPYQHYNDKQLVVYVKTSNMLTGFNLGNSFDYRFEDSYDELSFTKYNQQYFIDKPIINRYIQLVESVDCTRDSHCPKQILFQGELQDSTCNLIYHKCAIGQTYFDPVPPDKKYDIPLGGIVIVFILVSVIYILIKYGKRIFKIDSYNIKKT